MFGKIDEILPWFTLFLEIFSLDDSSSSDISFVQKSIDSLVGCFYPGRTKTKPCPILTVGTGYMSLYFPWLVAKSVDDCNWLSSSHRDCQY